jgi:hypothetical protein
MNIQIKNRYNNSVIFETDAKDIGRAAEAALKIEASLRGADLRGADLRGASLRGASLRGADLREANLREASLRGADLREADLRGADLREADLREADLRWASLRGADLREADLIGNKIKSGKVFSGLYTYIVMAILMPDGTRIVKMGCLEKTLEEWAELGIRKSNLNDFPDDGSEASEERVIAFEFAKATALALK